MHPLVYFYFGKKKKKQTNHVLDFPASGRHILEKLDTIEKEALTCANIQLESP